MITKRLSISLLAMTLALSLAGCAGLPTSGGSPASTLSGLLANLDPQQSAIVQSLVDDAVYAVQSNTNLTLSNDAVDSVPTTQSLIDDLLKARGGAPGEAPLSGQDFAHHIPPKLSALMAQDASASQALRLSRFMARAKQELASRKSQMHNVVRTTVTNSDGTKTVNITATVDRPNGNETNTINRTYDASGNLTELQSHMERTNASGFKIVLDRDRLLNSDGTWTITFAMTITRPDGKVKTITWTRTENADGTESGTGTLTRFDGTTETLTTSKDASGSITTTVTDTQTDLAAQVGSSDSNTQASVQVSNPSTGKVDSTTSVSDTESVEPGDQ